MSLVGLHRDLEHPGLVSLPEPRQYVVQHRDQILERLYVLRGAPVAPITESGRRRG